MAVTMPTDGLAARRSLLAGGGHDERKEVGQWVRGRTGRVLTISSQEGDLVFDPFGGSGTTYAVAERMHRNWIGIELGDCDPIVARLTGADTGDVMPNKGDASKGVGRSKKRSLRLGITMTPDITPGR